MEDPSIQLDEVSVIEPFINNNVITFDITFFPFMEFGIRIIIAKAVINQCNPDKIAYYTVVSYVKQK